MRLEDQIVVASVFEDGVDMNGDGDGTDAVLEIVDLRTGRKERIPNASRFALGDDFVSFLVPEWWRGGDLNGDGDLGDAVLHVHDASGRARTRPPTVNLGLAVDPSFPVAQEGALVAFAVDEWQQGEQDLDGDGNISSVLAYVYEADLARLTPLGIPVGRPSSTSRATRPPRSSTSTRAP